MKLFPFLRPDQAAPVARDVNVALPAFDEGRYRVHFAAEEHELHAAQRLRFEVFNVELQEGLAGSWENGRDEDRFDAACDHLLVSERSTGRVVGTYRMQSAQMAAAREGWYCDEEFHLDELAADVRAASVELGRACIAADSRNGTVLYALWRGLAAYAEHRGKRYFFGCCSLTSQDTSEAWHVQRYLEAGGHMLPGEPVRARDSHACPRPEEGDRRVASGVPTLFRTYLRFGAKVCSFPAIDRSFRTIDYLVLLDRERLTVRVRDLFFGGSGR